MAIRDFVKHIKQRARTVTFIALIAELCRIAVVVIYKPRRYRLWKNILRESDSKGRYITKRIQGSLMVLDIEDEGISRDLLIDGIREPKATSYFKNILKQGQIIADIGANIGYYALIEACAVGSTGYVYAIEPVPSNVKLLKQSTILNGHKNIEIYEAAVGQHNKLGNIIIKKSRNLCAMEGKTTKEDSDDSASVNIITLDRFFRDRQPPDIIRMDVEGYEVEIIEGAKQLLSNNTPMTIFMEVHFNRLQAKSIEMFEILQRYGFEVSQAFIEVLGVDSPIGLKAVSILNRFIGHNDKAKPPSIKEFMTQDKFLNGQIAMMEVFFTR